MLKLLFLTPAWLALMSGAWAQNADKPPQPPQPTQARERLKSEAKGLALAVEVTETISQRQLEIASQVLMGKATCDFNQHVNVQALNDQPGFFVVDFKNASYIMTPEETTSGAVRLANKKAGVMWLQIPNKSMLMNNKLGQRLVDNCKQAAQSAIKTN